MRYDGTKKKITVSNRIVSHIRKNVEVKPSIYFGDLKVDLTIEQATALSFDLNSAVLRAKAILENPRGYLESQGWTFDDDGTMTIRGR